jgi:integrase/recombinase XerD
MPTDLETSPAMLPAVGRTLTAEEFSSLADIPPETEWLANITNEKTKRAYRADVAEFMVFARLKRPAELRTIARAHVIAWRKTMEARELADATIGRKLSAISSLFEYLCERNAIAGNPVDGVKRPMSTSNEGSTPALGDEQAKRLLLAPPPDTLKGIRDSAILATLLYHGIRREELCKLCVGDMQTREGVMHFRIKGKRDKIRFVPIHPTAQRLIAEYLEMAKQPKHGGGRESDPDSPLFRPVKNNRTGTLEKHLDSGSVYRNIVRKYGRETGINAEVNGLCVHSLRATAATNALTNKADIAKVQEWLGHANISTTRLYDRRGSKPEEVRRSR